MTNFVPCSFAFGFKIEKQNTKKTRSLFFLKNTENYITN